METDTECLILIKNIKNPSNFDAIIGQIQDFDKLFNLETKLNEWCNKIDALYPNNFDELTLNQSVLVKHQPSDKTILDGIIWKRSKIVSINPIKGVCEVFLIDEAIVFEKSLNELRVNIPEFYHELEPQAKKCTLKNVQPQNDSLEWNQEAIYYFSSLMSLKGLKAKIIDKIKIQNPNQENKHFSEEYIVDIFRDKLNLRNMLISNGYAKMNTPSYINLDNPCQDSSTISSDKNLLDESQNEIEDITQTDGPRSKLNETINLESDEDDDDFVYLYSKNDEKKVETDINKSITASKRSISPSPNNSQNFDVNSDASYGSNSSSNKSAKKCRISLNDLHINSEKENSEQDYDSDQAIEDCDEIYICHKQPGTNKRILNPESQIYSDETISTGYRPNIDIDGDRLTREIKFANREQLLIQLGEEPLKQLPKPKLFEPSKNLFGKLKSTEEKIYDILGNSSTSLDFKVRALVRIYSEDTYENSIMIVTCILKEISNSNYTTDQGVLLLSQFRFCTDELVIKCLSEYVASFEAKYSDVTYSNLADADIKKVSILLANIYIASREKDLFCLKNVPKYCREKIKNWATINITKCLQNFEYKRNFKNVREFLGVCLPQFKQYDYEECEYVYQKARLYTMDITLKEDLKTETFLIVDLYANSYLKQNNFPKVNQPNKDKTSFASFGRNFTDRQPSNKNVFRYATFSKQ